MVSFQWLLLLALILVFQVSDASTISDTTKVGHDGSAGSDPGDQVAGSGDDATHSVSSDSMFAQLELTENNSSQPGNHSSLESTSHIMGVGSTSGDATHDVESTSDDTTVTKPTASRTVAIETIESASTTEKSTTEKPTTESKTIQTLGNNDVTTPDNDRSETPSSTSTITTQVTTTITEIPSDSETTAKLETTSTAKSETTSVAPHPTTSSTNKDLPLSTKEALPPLNPTRAIPDGTSARATESTSDENTKTTTEKSNKNNNEANKNTQSVNEESAFGKIGLFLVIPLVIVCFILIAVIILIAYRSCTRDSMTPGVEQGGAPRLKLHEIRDTGVSKKLPTKAQPMMGSDEVQTFSLDYEKHVQEKIEEHKRKTKPSGEPLTPTDSVSTFMLGKKPSVKYTASNASSGPRSPINQGEDAALLGNGNDDDKPVVFNFTKTPGESLKDRRPSNLDSKRTSSGNKEPLDTISDI